MSKKKRLIFFRLFSQVKRGQSLVEILMAVALGAIMIAAAATVISVSLKTNTQASRIQVGTGLAKGLLENVKVWSEQNWHNIVSLSTTSLNHYYLSTSTPPSAISGDEVITIGSSTYIRYFYIDDVGRDGNGKIVSSGGINDPSTKKITVEWSTNQVPTTSVSAYITRSRHKIYLQTDWSGGGGQQGPLTTVGNQFSTSSNIIYTTPGSIYIDL